MKKVGLVIVKSVNGEYVFVVVFYDLLIISEGYLW